MNHPQASIAIFRAKKPESETLDSGNTPWFRLLKEIYSNVNSSDIPIAIPSCMLCLELPTKLPTLCSLVELAQKSGLQHAVEIYGSSLLFYSSEDTPE